MSTTKVLLSGGRAAGLIHDATEAEIAAQRLTVKVPGICRTSPTELPTEAPETEDQVYEPTGTEASGYPVWGIVNE